MHYERAVSKRQVGRRIVLSWAALAVVFTAIGYGLGSMTGCQDDMPPAVVEPTESATSTTEAQDVLIYGLPDGKIREGTITYDYVRDTEFVVLELPIDEDVQRFAFELSTAYGIDYALVLAIMSRESGFTADVVSSTGAYGLMQVDDGSLEYLSEELGITSLADPYQNIRAGLFILHGLFEKYENVSDVLMAYNQGEAGAAILWRQGVHETSYTQEVLRRQAEYREQLGGGSDEQSSTR